MEKSQAAEFLGVSVRTLERFAASGRLTKGRALKKTRPVVVYDMAELERLREQLNEARPTEVFRRLNTPKPRDAIGFRLDPFYIKKLEEEGARIGMSAGEVARRMVIRSIEQIDSKDGVEALRKNLSDMFYLVLVNRLGASESEATQIVATLEKGR